MAENFDIEQRLRNSVLVNLRGEPRRVLYGHDPETRNLFQSGQYEIEPDSCRVAAVWTFAEAADKFLMEEANPQRLTDDEFRLVDEAVADAIKAGLLAPPVRSFDLPGSARTYFRRSR